MTAIPENPNARLTRDALAQALTEAGFPVKPATLATRAPRAAALLIDGLGPGHFISGRLRFRGWKVAR